MYDAQDALVSCNAWPSVHTALAPAPGPVPGQSPALWPTSSASPLAAPKPASRHASECGPIYSAGPTSLLYGPFGGTPDVGCHQGAHFRQCELWGGVYAGARAWALTDPNETGADSWTG